ncbi:MAG TPA: hypothetical protein VEI83_05815 [Acidimicrobiales bacterium]|nr:hypothetical protein [Acidimicrobiales bacterium]
MNQQPDAASTGPSTTTRRRRWGWTTAVLATAAVATAACSSSSSSTTPPPNPATAQSDIGVVYGTLFNLASKNASKMEASIQGGSALTTAINEALSSPLSTSATGATVTSATILSSSDCQAAKVPSPCAKVTYSILGPGGQVLLPNSTGYAAYVNGHWLVAKVTICGLFELLYQTENKTGTPPGC